LDVEHEFYTNERGRYNPSIQLAFRLARQFEVTIEDVFIYSEEEEYDA
jgi:putative transcriptional regulator